MFLAHAPAGYLLTRWMLRARELPIRTYNKLIALGMVANAAPDLDLIYHFGFDQAKAFHHYYWSHIPFWIALLYAISLLVSYAATRRKYWLIIHIVFCNWLLHMALDTATTGILWLYPWNTDLIGFFYWSDRFHLPLLAWLSYHEFLLELAIIAAASMVFLHNRPRKDSLWPF